MKYFIEIKYYSIFYKLFTTNNTFYGWGRKKSGLSAIVLAKKYNTQYTLLEDGFIRSLDLGVHNSPSFSIVKDTKGIYYDATSPSELENILNTYNFCLDSNLIKLSTKAMNLIIENNISKYNHAPNITTNFFQNNTTSKVLIIAQTSGDASLKYGLATKFTTKQIINDAISENPNASIYIKIHPDVLSGKKKSDIIMNEIPESCIILNEDFNPISLLKHFDKVYTKTSGMGMEALILGLDVVCYGIPYYSGWGLTEDKQKCARRSRKLTIEELFAGAYILYTKYYNPYTKKTSDIIDTINEIVRQKKML